MILSILLYVVVILLMVFIFCALCVGGKDE